MKSRKRGIVDHSTRGGCRRSTLSRTLFLLIVIKKLQIFQSGFFLLHYTFVPVVGWCKTALLECMCKFNTDLHNLRYFVNPWTWLWFLSGCFGNSRKGAIVQPLCYLCYNKTPLAPSFVLRTALSGSILFNYLFIQALSNGRSVS